ncbi:MAG TPA: class I adenylate-forming enzyme family protein [Planctomycetota bacterium]|jgi:acyl-coenzyme A synthetase/AMP-(fatty) acid ligase|nr:class I adenylate-forming enzyme family protein [Planctomycetota bacterium]
MTSAVARSPLLQSLERQVRDRGRLRALHSEAERRSFTFAQLGERVRAWAASLQKAGVQAGQLVAIALGNIPAFAEIFFALRLLDAAALLVDEGNASVSSKMGASWVLRRDAGIPIDGGPDPDVQLSPLRPEGTIPAGTALIKLTSGSTLSPRGACFSEDALVDGIEHILRGMEITPDDRVLLSIPLSHGYGFDNGVLSLAAGGTPLILQSDILPGALLRSLREHEITFFPAVPALIRALGQVAWPESLALRRVISASAPLSREAAEAFRRASGLPVGQFFGSTETGGISFESRPDDPGAEGCVGFPLPGVRIELADGGAVRVHSSANRFAVLPEQAVPAYVETGDRASWSADGRLKLEGRATLVANVGGLKVDLGALDAFFRALPGVDEAAAVPLDDPAAGQRVVAYVETGSWTEARLLQVCREKLSAREVPDEIRVVPRLPRNARGKLDRGALGSLGRGGC